MEPPEGESGPPPATRSSRVLGLVAAVGFSIAMWVFIAVAVLGLILKVLGPREVREGLAAGFSTVFPATPEETPAGEEDLSKALSGEPFQVLGKDGKPPAAPPARTAPAK